MIRMYLLIAILCVAQSVSSQKSVSNEIALLQTFGQPFKKTELFHFQTQDIHSRDQDLEGLTQGTILKLDPASIESLFNNHDEFISLSVPITNRAQMILTLRRHEIFTPDFKMFTSEDRLHPMNFNPGFHYKGIVEGDENSVVALSIFQDQVMCLIATDEGNFVIGEIEGNDQHQHIFYNDKDLDHAFEFACDTRNEDIGYTEEQLSPVFNMRDVNDCVRIYIEVNDDIVTAKGGAIPAANYMTAIFNQCIVLYANEQISMTLSEMLLWTIPSPYNGTGSGTMLQSYQAATDYFNGDLSHLISFDSLYGGVTNSLAGICNGNVDASKCFSGIRHNYDIVPIFSFPVFVITHEMGHLMGSNHTHACVWNGNNTAIDGCGPTSCAPVPPLPPQGGTIMSYCYPSNGSFINFNLGFGPQPGNVIRNSVNAASNCLTPCGPQSGYCTSNGIASTLEYITKIVLGNINNQTASNGGYGNFTALTANLNAGNTYTVALTPKFTGGNNVKYWKVWIDYNHDFDFYDAGECVAQGSGNNAVNLNFTVPAGATNIATRMRVSMKLAGYPLFCGPFASGEVEDYTANIVGVIPTCSDGIQNQGETGIDCGGPCPACPPAPTCNDGIQNQNETGIDCGGPCAPCPMPDSTILLASYFETGLDTWIDGGPDINRVQTSNSWEGQYSIELADNSGAQSAMTSPNFNLSTAVGAKISFHYYAVSMEAGEDFWVQYKSGSGNWVTIGTYIAGTNFNNNVFYASTITVPNFTPTTSGTFRIQCDASDNNDNVYIDAVIITRLNTNPINAPVQNLSILEGHSNLTPQERNGEIFVYPNPVKDLLHLSFDGEIQSIRIMTLDGHVMNVAEESISNRQISTESLAPGLYFLWVESAGEWYPARFSKL